MVPVMFSSPVYFCLVVFSLFSIQEERIETSRRIFPVLESFESFQDLLRALITCIYESFFLTIYSIREAMYRFDRSQLFLSESMKSELHLSTMTFYRSSHVEQNTL